jgi:hypothetical protein
VLYGNSPTTKHTWHKNKRLRDGLRLGAHMHECLLQNLAFQLQRKVDPAVTLLLIFSLANRERGPCERFEHVETCSSAWVCPAHRNRDVTWWTWVDPPKPNRGGELAYLIRRPPLSFFFKKKSRLLACTTQGHVTATILVTILSEYHGRGRNLRRVA